LFGNVTYCKIRATGASGVLWPKKFNVNKNMSLCEWPDDPRNCQEINVSTTMYSQKWENSWDQELNFTCPPGLALTTFTSGDWDTVQKDRRFKFGCGPIDSACKVETGLSNFSSLSYINDLEGDMDFACNSTQVITGIYAVHLNAKGDRRYKVRCSQLWPPSPGPQYQCYVHLPVWDSQPVNDYHGDFNKTCASGKLITGIKSEHDSSQEDRRFKFQCARIKICVSPKEHLNVNNVNHCGNKGPSVTNLPLANEGEIEWISVGIRNGAQRTAQWEICVAPGLYWTNDGCETVWKYNEKVTTGGKNDNDLATEWLGANDVAAFWDYP
jgi:hypothetical protein